VNNILLITRVKLGTILTWHSH